MLVTSWKGVEQEDQNRTWVCERPLGDPGWEKRMRRRSERRSELGRGPLSPSLSLSFCLSLSHHRRASSLWLLPGRWLRDYQECLEPSNLLLDSWMEQKGVDGFALSVWFFHIQQIRAGELLWRRHGGGLPAHLHHKRGARQRGLRVSQRHLFLLKCF